MDATEAVYAQLQELIPTLATYWNDLFRARAPECEFRFSYEDSFPDDRVRNFHIIITSLDGDSRHVIWEISQLDIVEDQLNVMIRGAIARRSSSAEQ